MTRKDHGHQVSPSGDHIGHIMHADDKLNHTNLAHILFALKNFFTAMLVLHSMNVKSLKTANVYRSIRTCENHCAEFSLRNYLTQNLLQL